MKPLLDQLEKTENPDLEHRLRIISQAMDYSIVRLHKKQNPPLCAIRIAKALGMKPEILALLKELDK